MKQKSQEVILGILARNRKAKAFAKAKAPPTPTRRGACQPRCNLDAQFVILLCQQDLGINWQLPH